MITRWSYRKAHLRRLATGRIVPVRETVVSCTTNAVPQNGSFQHQCRKCGAGIISVRMPNGGWAHFEAAPGLTRIKHPCLHRGEGLPQHRDDRTLDIFDFLQE